MARTLRDIQRERQETKKLEHKQMLAEKFGLVGHPKLDKLHDFAWNFGHASGCIINSQVGGDHAYCSCHCHAGSFPAIPPSRERRKDDEVRARLVEYSSAAYEMYNEKDMRDEISRLRASNACLLEALEVIEACGEPSKISMYDEEGVEGWRWTHPDGREWTSTGLWENEAPPHPIVREMLNEFGRINL